MSSEVQLSSVSCEVVFGFARELLASNLIPCYPEAGWEGTLCYFELLVVSLVRD